VRLIDRLKCIQQRIVREARFYRRVATHPRVPLASRLLLGAALAYLVSPVDLIPDWIPVLGQLDDLLIVPALVFLALQFIPRPVLAECRDAEGGAAAA
jgi:uncharacterized membrane protein YkvA (DUF1232 family)